MKSCLQLCILATTHYEAAKSCARLHEITGKFRLERYVTKGDTISPKLFTNVLEYKLKMINWDDV